MPRPGRATGYSSAFGSRTTARGASALMSGRSRGPRRTAVSSTLADAELLIADGHHRYETARTYADAIGGDGPHRYTLMCVVSLEDPGLTVFPTHRLLTGLDSARQEALAAGLRELFEIDEVP